MRRDGWRVDAGRLHAVQRGGEAVLVQGARVEHLPGTVAAIAMLVLGDVAEKREEAVGAGDGNRRHLIEPIQQRFQLALGVMVAIASETYRRLPDTLDQIERPVAMLLAQRVAEQATEVANILA